MLNARFGHKWVKKHHFDNKGKLPAKVSEARRLIERDDIDSLNIGATGKKFARMNSKEAFKTTDGTDEKWKTSLKLRAELGGESPSAAMKSKDAVGKVQHAFKETRAQQIVSRMLD